MPVSEVFRKLLHSEPQADLLIFAAFCVIGSWLGTHPVSVSVQKGVSDCEKRFSGLGKWSSNFSFLTSCANKKFTKFYISGPVRSGHIL